MGDEADFGARSDGTEHELRKSGTITCSEVWRTTLTRASTMAPSRPREWEGSAPICPHCHVEAVLRDNSVIYGRTYGHGLTWICPNFGNGCDRYVGAHPSGKPQGTLADRRLREARQGAHDAFDPLWLDGPKKGRRARKKRAYQWMQSVLGIGPDECHIGMFDEAQCARLIEAVAGKGVKTDG
jgi:hypothetical protein